MALVLRGKDEATAVAGGVVGAWECATNQFGGDELTGRRQLGVELERLYARAGDVAGRARAASYIVAGPVACLSLGRYRPRLVGLQFGAAGFHGGTVATVAFRFYLLTH